MRSVDAELRRRSAWRLLVPPLMVVLVVIAAVATAAITGATEGAATVLTGGVGLIALWAVADGLARAAGRATYLGIGRGFDRLLGLFQAGAAIGLALALLPNTLEFLNALARLAVGAT